MVTLHYDPATPHTLVQVWDAYQIVGGWPVAAREVRVHCELHTKTVHWKLGEVGDHTLVPAEQGILVFESMRTNTRAPPAPSFALRPWPSPATTAVTGGGTTWRPEASVSWLTYPDSL